MTRLGDDKAVVPIKAEYSYATCGQKSSNGSGRNVGDQSLRKPRISGQVAETREDDAMRRRAPRRAGPVVGGGGAAGGTSHTQDAKKRSLACAGAK